MNTTTLEEDLGKIGSYIQGLAKTQKKTLRQIAKDTSLSINSVKVVFSGKPGNIATYDSVARYLGTSFCQAVIDASTSSTTQVEATTNA